MCVCQGKRDRVRHFITVKMPSWMDGWMTETVKHTMYYAIRC